MSKESLEYQLLTDKMIDLESQLAFQDHTIQELNDVVTKQQTELMQFKKQLIKINRQLETQPSNNTGDSTPEPPPPHY